MLASATDWRVCAGVWRVGWISSNNHEQSKNVSFILQNFKQNFVRIHNCTKCLTVNESWLGGSWELLIFPYSSICRIWKYAGTCIQFMLGSVQYNLPSNLYYQRVPGWVGTYWVQLRASCYIFTFFLPCESFHFWNHFPRFASKAGSQNTGQKQTIQRHIHIFHRFLKFLLYLQMIWPKQNKNIQGCKNITNNAIS